MLALEGITVVTLEHAIAAPFCTRQLADLGARVIKVERPGVGDFARGYDERVKGLASHFVWTNRSKESITLDVKHEAARGVLSRLVERADVLVQNLAPGAAARLGLSHEALREAHPRLIVCDISGYGSDGPYRDKKAYDLLIQSESGFVSITGSPDEPAKAGNSIADIAAWPGRWMPAEQAEQYPNTWRWFSEIAQRPAVKRGREADMAVPTKYMQRKAVLSADEWSNLFGETMWGAVRL